MRPESRRRSSRASRADRSVRSVRPSRSTRPTRRGGFALVAALAILVLLATMGAMMLRLTGLQQSGSSLAILGTRADFAARSGLDWGVSQSIAAGTCPAASTTLALSEGALAGFNVVVSCTASTHVEGSRTRTFVALRARAEYGAMGARDHVVREMGASLVL